MFPCYFVFHISLQLSISFVIFFLFYFFPPFPFPLVFPLFLFIHFSFLSFSSKVFPCFIIFHSFHLNILHSVKHFCHSFSTLLFPSVSFSVSFLSSHLPLSSISHHIFFPTSSISFPFFFTYVLRFASCSFGFCVSYLSTLLSYPFKQPAFLNHRYISLVSSIAFYGLSFLSFRFPCSLNPPFLSIFLFLFLSPFSPDSFSHFPFSHKFFPWFPSLSLFIYFFLRVLQC